jgi:hypothetical protein
MGRARRLAPKVALVHVILTLITAPSTALLAAVMACVQATANVLPGCFVANLAPRLSRVYRHPKEGDL